MDITIWKVSHGPAFFNEKQLKDYQEKNVVSVHVNTGAKGQSSVTQAEDFKNVKKGDFFYLCHGNQSIILFGIFTGVMNIPDDGWAEQEYKLIWTSIKTGPYDDEKKWWTPNDNSSFIKVNDNKLFEKLILKPYFGKTITDLQIISKKMKAMDFMQEKKSLLLSNHNLILTGAPGTGKTYLAKQIAQQMIFGEVIEKMSLAEEKRFNKQCGFVQFHPSYDYTDFVEGLRPVQDDGGNVGFERKDGVFKDFCARAIAKKTNEESIFDEVWDKLISDIRINLSTGKLTKIGGWEYGLSTKDSLKYSSINTPSQYSFTITKKNIWDTYCGRQARPSGAFQKDMLDIVRYLKQTYDLPDKPKLTENDDKTTKPFVFIIDEINRGEISKILGELFFSIDPGYRGTDGKVRTQYANMQTEPNEFDSALKITDVNNCGHFFVPENVYIIGTMNDIDRSVESMDFAFRRRFAFKEIKAEDTRNMLDKEEAWKDENGKIVSPSTETITIIKNRMNNLNNAIWDKKTKSGIEGLSSAYHIGASYFLKLVNYRNDKGEYVDQSFTDLWNNHLDGLLREYMRGMQNVDEKMEKLKAAYDNESDSNN